jgi:hypothetical protein
LVLPPGVIFPERIQGVTTTIVRPAGRHVRVYKLRRWEIQALLAKRESYRGFILIRNLIRAKNCIE